MKFQSEKNGENKESINTPSSALINSLRNQINKVSALNKFCFINGNKKPLESEVQISDIADKIRNKISTSKINQNPGLEHEKNNYSEEIGGVYSPFRKRNKNNEKYSLQNNMSNFEQTRSELENLLLYNINKLRHERIKLKNCQANNNNNNSNDENEILFPNIYTPLSSMKFMNIQELFLFLSLFYHNYQREWILPLLNNLKNLEIVFFTPESTSSSYSSTIITGRYTKILNEEYLFSSNAPISKLILNSAK
ncbi:hypothetical protein CmeUKMEL1_08975 [Cryptosporidium meleagridis]|uniref:Uncharacterized protein n=1 Tax=Cryptosporidium meleagridis TaxID=93969 RepID=A0A2P4Z0Z8_9CRYT|nr:hypothetical protein CmeUKMEL1_08975 [Cryptosporidium meleagridis]